jgi:hypothetical protein
MQNRFISFAIKLKTRVRFTTVTGDIFEGVITDRDSYAVEVDGESVVFKHGLIQMTALPKDDAPSHGMTAEDAANSPLEEPSANPFEKQNACPENGEA